MTQFRLVEPGGQHARDIAPTCLEEGQRVRFDGDTRSVVEELREQSPDVELVYCFEPEQGVSYARNTGIANARASIRIAKPRMISAQPGEA